MSEKKILSKLTEHSQILTEHSRILTEHGRILTEHGQLLREHSRILTKHSQILTENSQLLTENSQLLREHSRELKSIRETMDSMVGILQRLDQERIFTADWVHRIEERVSMSEKELQDQKHDLKHIKLKLKIA